MKVGPIVFVMVAGLGMGCGSTSATVEGDEFEVVEVSPEEEADSLNAVGDDGSLGESEAELSAGCNILDAVTCSERNDQVVGYVTTQLRYSRSCGQAWTRVNTQASGSVARQISIRLYDLAGRYLLGFHRNISNDVYQVSTQKMTASGNPFLFRSCWRSIPNVSKSAKPYGKHYCTGYRTLPGPCQL